MDWQIYDPEFKYHSEFHPAPIIDNTPIHLSYILTQDIEANSMRIMARREKRPDGDCVTDGNSKFYRDPHRIILSNHQDTESNYNLCSRIETSS